MNEKVLKCCGKLPNIYDYRYDSYNCFKCFFRCKKCGHHIHSDKENWKDAIPVWNRSIRRKL